MNDELKERLIAMAVVLGFGVTLILIIVIIGSVSRLMN